MKHDDITTACGITMGYYKAGNFSNCAPTISSNMQLIFFVFVSSLVMSIIASPAPFSAAPVTLRRSSLLNQCGAPCTTTCYSQPGGGPDPNDCTVLAVGFPLGMNSAHHFIIYIWQFGPLCYLLQCQSLFCKSIRTGFIVLGLAHQF